MVDISRGFEGDVLANGLLDMFMYSVPLWLYAIIPIISRYRSDVIVIVVPLGVNFTSAFIVDSIVDSDDDRLFW